MVFYSVFTEQSKLGMPHIFYSYRIGAGSVGHYFASINHFATSTYNYRL